MDNIKKFKLAGYKDVKDARMALRYTQQEVADSSGIAVQTIRNFEVGRSDMSFSNLQNVLKTMGYELVAHKIPKYRKVKNESNIDN